MYKSPRGLKRKDIKMANSNLYFELEKCSYETFLGVCELNRLADNRDKSYALTFANNFSITNSKQLNLQTCKGIRKDCFFPLKERNTFIENQVTRFNLAVGTGAVTIIAFNVKNLLCINIIPDNDEVSANLSKLWKNI